MLNSDQKILAPIVKVKSLRCEQLRDIPKKIIDSQRLITVYYYGYDNKIHKGQLVCHYSVVNSLKLVFDKLLEDKFPIYSVIPVNAFEWDVWFPQAGPYLGETLFHW